MLDRNIKEELQQINDLLDKTTRGGQSEVEELSVILSKRPFIESDLQEIEKKATPQLLRIWKEKAQDTTISQDQIERLAHVFKDPVAQICSGIGINIATGFKLADKNMTDDLMECDNDLINMLPKAQKVLEDIVYNYTRLLGDKTPYYIREDIATYADAARQIGEIYQQIPETLKETAQRSRPGSGKNKYDGEHLEPLNLSDGFKTPGL